VDIPVVTPPHDGDLAGYTVVPGGTSAAAALVAGVAALVRARYPQLTAAGVVQRLIATADDAGPPGRDDGYGSGRLNPVRALTAEVAPVAANPLGTPTAPPSAPPAAAPDDRGVRVTPVLALGAGLVCCLVVAAAAALLLILLLRRRRASGTGQGARRDQPRMERIHE
jgi:subtilisin family serine protease